MALSSLQGITTVEVLENGAEYDRAYANHSRLVNLKSEAQKISIYTGEVLYEIKKNQQYRLLGYDTFESYLASPELSFSRSAAFMMISIYQRFILELKVQPVGLLEADISKLEVIRPYVTSSNVDELLNDAIALSRSDLKKNIAERFDKPELAKEFVSKTDLVQVMDELYKDLFTLTKVTDLPSQKKYRNAKRILEGEGWNERIDNIDKE